MAQSPRLRLGFGYENLNGTPTVREGSEVRSKMDKRLAKRHKRQTDRAKERIKISEPDVRTPEEIKAAREASQSAINRGGAGNVQGSASTNVMSRSPKVGGAAKTDAG